LIQSKRRSPHTVQVEIKVRLGILAALIRESTFLAADRLPRLSQWTASSALSTGPIWDGIMNVTNPLGSREIEKSSEVAVRRNTGELAREQAERGELMVSSAEEYASGEGPWNVGASSGRPRRTGW
jgi:hypothetical protein